MRDLSHRQVPNQAFLGVSGHITPTFIENHIAMKWVVVSSRMCILEQQTSSQA